MDSAGGVATRDGGRALTGEPVGDIALQKRTVRKEVLAKRSQMNVELRERKSAKVCKRVEELLVQEFERRNVLAPVVAHDGAKQQKAHSACAAPVVALYSAFGSELSLDNLVACAESHGWQIAMPCMISEASSNTGAKDAVTTSTSSAHAQKQSAEMVFVRVSCEQAIKRELSFLSSPASAIAACELQELEVLKPSQIDAMIVPLVSFDVQGARLGYGGGNYDRYIPQLKPECFVAAVAFEEQRVESLPCESFDCTVEQVVFA